MIKIITRISAKTYSSVVKRIIFKFDPEKVHDKTITLAKISGRINPISFLINKAWSYNDQALSQKVDGISYANPIGLAAGWDKNAETIKLMPSLGFGFTEVGSITKDSYAGNDGTRLWRLPKSKSIMVYYGLKNIGVDIIAPRINSQHVDIPVGTNIARTNSKDCSDDNVSIEDYAYSFRKLAIIGDYFTVNISCPNTFGGQPFHEKHKLDLLLTKLDSIPTKKPIYLKISPDISMKEREDIAKLTFKHRVNGIICGNASKNHQLTTIKEKNLPAVGGLTGKVIQKLSDELISDMYRLTEGKKTIIGLGGVFTAEDAYTKIKLGASLVQMVTGLIYQGPQVVGQINHDLSKLLQKDGYNNISDAIGSLDKID
ncbi:quinone-dependent dihydroorotate dehydrogenase [Candidatus Saccharibacteria bacterium]|jgi:dihydroorotate dehydrogenase|nr:quinone-dependent dihydroorotate dehydrogenase [Candidatus Saccharibacteria bacterium]MBP7835076.1 quinone-dependent dihydroorotate dehydrogenase [Candidatus Saccharibacteria bacterium]